MITPNQKTWKRHLQHHRALNPGVTQEQFSKMEALGLKPRWTRRGEFCEAFDPREGRRVSFSFASTADGVISSAEKVQM